MKILAVYPMNADGFTCPFCGKIIAEGQFVIGVWTLGEDDPSLPPKQIVADNKKATCCPQGSALCLPYASNDFRKITAETDRLIGENIAGNIDEKRFMGFGEKAPPANFLNS